MVTPEELRAKAERLYTPAIYAWLEGDAAFFPRLIPANLVPPKDFLEVQTQVEALRQGSKQHLGYGYTVQWEERRSKLYSLNRFPVKVTIDSLDDLLRLVGRQQEFSVLRTCVNQLRERLPQLDSWLLQKSNWKRLLTVAPSLDELLRVAEYLPAHPRPNCFMRELPLNISTKLLERNKVLLGEWLDALLPVTAIDFGYRYEQFALRYGFRVATDHLRMRVLDTCLLPELGLPADDLALSPKTIGQLKVRDVSVHIVENKVNLMTLPHMPRSLAFGGMGHGVTRLFETPWLASAPIFYWGDLDQAGLEILATLRGRFPQTKSYFMEQATLERYSHLLVHQSGRQNAVPRELTEEESAAYRQCRDRQIRLEQEHIPHLDAACKLRELGLA